MELKYQRHPAGRNLFTGRFNAGKQFDRAPDTAWCRNCAQYKPLNEVEGNCPMHSAVNVFNWCINFTHSEKEET